jgi:hypothetical protein
VRNTIARSACAPYGVAGTGSERTHCCHGFFAVDGCPKSKQTASDLQRCDDVAHGHLTKPLEPASKRPIAEGAHVGYRLSKSTGLETFCKLESEAGDATRIYAAQLSVVKGVCESDGQRWDCPCGRGRSGSFEFVEERSHKRATRNDGRDKPMLPHSSRCNPNQGGASPRWTADACCHGRAAASVCSAVPLGAAENFTLLGSGWYGAGGLARGTAEARRVVDAAVHGPRRMPLRLATHTQPDRALKIVSLIPRVKVLPDTILSKPVWT